MENHDRLHPERRRYLKTFPLIFSLCRCYIRVYSKVRKEERSRGEETDLTSIAVVLFAGQTRNKGNGKKLAMELTKCCHLSTEIHKTFLETKVFKQSLC